MKTKIWIIAILLMPFLMNCSSESMNSKGNVALVEKYVQAVENLDYETMASLLDENYKGFGPSYGDSINKSTAVENWKYSSENIYKSIKYNRSRNASITIHDGENKGEWISNWAELTINYQWTEIPVTLWANTIYRIENGKIVKSYTFYNEADAYRQLGYGFVDFNN